MFTCSSTNSPTITNMSVRRIFTRKNSCTAFQPLNDNYKTLRHLHFPGITTFERGQKIQNAIVGANLDFKKVELKIKKQQLIATAQGLVLNEYEDNLLKKILEMKPFPTLLTFEFENVYTGGKQMKSDVNMESKIRQYEALGCKYHQLERGGQVTWHGQGQLVAYLILDLKQFRNLTVKCFVDSVLLRGLQNVLTKNYKLDSGLSRENPGVWVGSQKIASVGTNIQRAITSYGIGLNVEPDLKYLNTYEMCGLPNKATSIRELAPGAELSVKKAGDEYAKELARLLNITTVEHMSGEDIEIE